MNPVKKGMASGNDAPRQGSVLKLGGSVITVKGDPNLQVRVPTLERIAEEVAAVSPEQRPKVLIHGAGSFGHQIVARTRIHEGVHTQEHRLAWAETQILQNELDAMVCRVFGKKGLPAFPYQASSAGWARDKKLFSLELHSLERLIAEGLLPVLYGVPAPDDAGGCAIVSGDALAVAVARRIGAQWILHGTDVDGVFCWDPKGGGRSETPERWPRVSRNNWAEVRAGLTGSTSPDVTGGMGGKVKEALELSREGIAARIFDATRGGSVSAALRGEDLGTLIQW